MIRVVTPGLIAGFFVATLAAVPPSFAESNAIVLPEITVFSPFRGIATPIARAGSAVSVITREEIERAGPSSVAEILLSVPGVSVTGAGGYGSSGDVFIRGGENQHTMVLIDGVPVSNPTSTRNTFDYSSISPDLIEQIEVLRGPQSALYGSDAMGGVINIITRQASRGLHGSASIEAGSFGTHRETFDVSYGSSVGGILASVSHTYSDGFSRRDSNLEDDSTRQWSGFIRGTLHAGEDLSIDGQVQINQIDSQSDERASDQTGRRELDTYNGLIRVRHESFDDRWINTVTLYGGINDNFDDKGADPGSGPDDTFYRGQRAGTEFTSQFNFGDYGMLLTGLSAERQEARQTRIGRAPTYDESEIYLAAFAMHQFSIGQNLHLSAALRIDDFDAAGVFVTGRGTALYEIFETETRLHASVGTGANAPTLYQRFAETRFNPNLLAEESIGFDLGITQVLFDGRATVDVTGFYNRYENLIDYQGNFTTGLYVNVAEAETYGVEVTADARLIPGQLDASAHYTYLVADDNITGLRLARRPEHEGQLTLTYVGIDRLSLSTTVSAVGGDWFNDDANTTRLDPYVRVDVNASYQAHEHLELFARIENLFDADYQVRDGYNTPGLSAYAGIRATY
jgi:vitamin B12 transporter